MKVMMLAFALLLVFVFGYIVVVSFSYSHSNDKDFYGLSNDSNKDKNIHIVVIHGIGSHCIGYSEELLTGILANMGIENKILNPHCEFPGALDSSEENKDGTKRIKNIYQLDMTIAKQTSTCLVTLGCEVIRLTQSLEPDTVGNLSVCNNYDYENRRLKSTKCIIKRVVGFIWTKEFDRENNKKIRTYEITWDPATRWSKTDYIDKTDILYKSNRSLFNGDLKSNLVNQSIADAVLYLGDYQPVMQYPLIIGFCKVLSFGSPDGKISNIEVVAEGEVPHIKPFICNPEHLANNIEINGKFEDNNSISIITHSLGTRMLFDVLGLLGQDINIFEYFIDLLKIPVALVYQNTHNAKSKMGISSEYLKNTFAKAVDSLYLFANQIPLLELSLVKSPIDTIKSRHATEGKENPGLGNHFDKFINKRQKLEVRKPLQIVTFTDNNDILSYNLKCWYYMTEIRYVASLKPSVHLDESWEHMTSEDQEAKLKEYSQDPYYSCNSDESEIYWSKIKEKMVFSDVTVNLPKFTLPILLTNPLLAHSGYFIEKKIFKLVACGGSVGDHIKSCDNTLVE